MNLEILGLLAIVCALVTILITIYYAQKNNEEEQRKRREAELQACVEPEGEGMGQVRRKDLPEPDCWEIVVGYHLLVKNQSTRGNALIRAKLEDKRQGKEEHSITTMLPSDKDNYGQGFPSQGITEFPLNIGPGSAERVVLFFIIGPPKSTQEWIEFLPDSKNFRIELTDTYNRKVLLAC